MIGWRQEKASVIHLSKIYKEELYTPEELEQLKLNPKKKCSTVGVLGRWMAKLPPWRVLYPLYVAHQLDTVVQVRYFAGLPEVFDGLTLAYASDIHYGPLFKEDRVRELARRINGLQADVVLLGGDYGQNSFDAIDFFQLKPGFRGKEAVLAALGNHDRKFPEANLPKLKQAMRDDGVIPVINEAWIMERQGKKLAFASTDDCFNGQPDLQAVAQQCAEADFTIFFPHNPDILPNTFDMPGGVFYQLAICGHTHGGQVTFRGRTIHYSSLTGRRFLSGWYRENGVDILVSNGVGTSGLPVRLEARPQLHLLTLKRKEA